MIRPRAASPLGTLSRRSRLWWRRGAFAVVFIVACLYPVVVNNGFVLDIATDMALWAVLAIGLNAVLGWAGLLDLGYIAFFALGGYTYAILSSMHIMSFWPSLVVGLVISAIAAVIIGVPTLRLHSDYLAIMTLGFGLIVYVAAENLNITGGDNGLFGYPPPRIGSLVIDSPLSYYLLAVALTVVALAVAVWVRKSRLGRAWLLLHADETAASSVGIPVYRYKLYAYMFGSIWGTLSGALFAVKETIVSPISFDWTESFFVVAAVVIGGTGSIAGCVVGGVVYVFISEAIGGIDATLSGVIFAGAMLGFILLRPRGLVPARREYRDGGRSLAPRPLQLSVAPSGAPDVSPFVGAPQDAAAERAVSLRAEGVTVRFGGVQAVDGVSVAATNGTVLALIGSNGAGKTTFLNAISGLATVREGRIFARLGTRDVDLTRLGARARARFGIGRTFQSPRLARDLTVWENVLQGTFVPSGPQSGWRGFLFGMSSSSDSGRRRTADALALVGLSGKVDEIAGDLPYGDQRRCEIGRSVASDPSFILMDEPSSGMNDIEAKAIVELVRTLAARGIGVVIVEHNMNIVRAVADTVVAMDLGRVIAQGTPEAVLDDPVVRGRFLGESDATGASSESLDGLGAGRGRVSGGGVGQILDAVDVCAGYGRAEVLFGVSLQLCPGECVALLGANGAGKTTLLRALSGIVTVRSGTVVLGTRDITNLATERIVRAGVAHVPEGRGLFATMSVEDNIRIGGYTLNGAVAEMRVAQVLELFPQMVARRRQAAGQLSGGEQQMVAMMRGLMVAPHVLLLDEPTLGLSPAARKDVLTAIGKERDAGLAVLMVEQNARKALEASDRCCVMRSGRIVYEATAHDALVSYEDLANEYLGAGEE